MTEDASPSSPFLENGGQNVSILTMLYGTVGSTFEGFACFPSLVSREAVFTKADRSLFSSFL